MPASFHEGHENTRRGTSSLWHFDTLPIVLYAGLVIVVVALRLAQGWALEAPLWGDSVQHTVMAQLMLDNGGLFDSWQPYAPYESLTVQYGFSSAVAVFSWLTGVSALQASVVVGQLVGALAVFALYPLALRLSGSRWAALLAVLLAAVIAPTPAAYFNWGRYAQLIGQAVLPVALWLCWEALERAGETQPILAWGAILLGALTASGMALGSYRLIFFYPTFIMPLLLCWALPRWGWQPSRWLRAMLALGTLAALGLALLAPWALHSATTGRLGTAVQRSTTNTQSLERILADYASWWSLPQYLSWTLALLAFAALCYGLARRQWQAGLLGLWALLAALIVAGRLVGLPGATLMQSFAIVIWVYLPAALLAGWLLGLGIEQLLKRRAQAAVPLGVVLAALALVAAWQQLGIADRATYGLVTRADTRAAAWIRANTPPDARFLVQGFRSPNSVAVVGSDAGWWLPLLSGRQNTIAPEYAFINERPSIPNYSQTMINLVEGLGEHSPDSKEGLRLLCAAGVTHVYNGQRQGSVGNQAAPLFNPADLGDSQAFTRIYHQDSVEIFALDQSRCTQ